MERTHEQVQAQDWASGQRALAQRVEKTLIERLYLEHRPGEIGGDAALFGNGIGLDSIDMLEVVVAIESEFGVRIEDEEMARLRSINTIVEIVAEKRGPEPEDATGEVQEEAGTGAPAPAQDDASGGGEHDDARTREHAGRPSGAPSRRSTQRDYARMREHAGLADLDDWARFEVRGREAREVVDAVVGASMIDLFDDRAIHTLIPSHEGTVEAIVWLITTEDGVRVLAEPADRNAVRAALEAGTRGRDAQMHDLCESEFTLALIGPDTERIAREAFGDEVRGMAFLNARRLGEPKVLAARLGHFGEDELYLFGDAHEKAALAERLDAAGGGNLRVGKGAFPVMMTEMGTRSRTRDIPAGTSVLEAGLEWMIDFRKRNLRGGEALERAKAAVKRRAMLTTMRGWDAGVENRVRVGTRDIGWVQCAYGSPKLGQAIGLAYLEEDMAVPGVQCTVGARAHPAQTIATPAFATRSFLQSLD